MMSALSISEPSAIRIRSGKCIPHARHWIIGLGVDTAQPGNARDRARFEVGLEPSGERHADVILGNSCGA